MLHIFHLIRFSVAETSAICAIDPGCDAFYQSSNDGLARQFKPKNCSLLPGTRDAATNAYLTEEKFTSLKGKNVEIAYTLYGSWNTAYTVVDSKKAAFAPLEI